LNGAQYILNFLKEKGVKISFGYPGGAVLTLYDEMAKMNFPHILTRHEQGAIHAAERYAKVSGEVGVVFATSGPGATNLVTGLANAYLDSTPIIAITGQVNSTTIGRDSFQEADVTGITTPITKHNFLVKDINFLPSALHNAWRIATEGRKGPVLLDVTKDVFAAEISSPVVKMDEKAKRYDDLHKIVPQIVKELKKAKRPHILVGGGVNSNECRELLEKILKRLNLCVSTTMMAKGVIDENEEYALGITGMHGKVAANLSMVHCDLLLAIGTRFSDRVVGNGDLYSEKHKVIHVDIDAAEINKNVPAYIGVCARAEEFLKALLIVLEKEDVKNLWDDWKSKVLSWKELEKDDVKISGLLPQDVIKAVNKYAGDRAVVVTDVGQNQMFCAQHYKMRYPNRFVTSGGLGTMGFGLPAAVGSAVSNPDNNTVLFVGDGGVQMTIQELATVKKVNLPIKIFILDNRCLGMVRQWQELFYNKNYSHTILDDNPDFIKIAEAYGIKSAVLDEKSDLEQEVKRICEEKEPVLVHCRLYREENVYPMIPPGKNPEDMFGRNNRKFE